jgi:hypothetical protein
VENDWSEAVIRSVVFGGRDWMGYVAVSREPSEKVTVVVFGKRGAACAIDGHRAEGRTSWHGNDSGCQGIPI